LVRNEGMDGGLSIPSAQGVAAMGHVDNPMAAIRCLSEEQGDYNEYD
jgi:hypothetical protein